MKKLNFNFGLTIVLFTILTTVSIHAQNFAYEISMEEQIASSTQIVEGKMISKKSFWDAGRKNIYTAYTIEVYKVFKGQPLNEVEIITEGGVIDLQAEVVSNSLQLRDGDIGLFMLTNTNVSISTDVTNTNKFKSVSASQGFYKYSLSNNKVVNTYKSIEGITSDFYDKILQHTNARVIDVKRFSVSETIELSTLVNARVNMASSISSFSSPSYTAGTKSVLTINGSGFGTNIGTIGFSNADYGGLLHVNTLSSQIINWSDTQIEVEIPDYAGTGTIKVNTVLNGSAESSNNLPIDFAQINIEYSGVDYQAQHIDNNNNGGNTWEMNQDFYNSQAKEAFERAFTNWSCQAGINWDISTTTTSNSTITNDDVNLITFNVMTSGLLGRCTSRYSGCFVDGAVKWYVEETDIVFNSTVNWNFATSDPLSGQVDFESVALHELGHGQQLGHVIDTDVVMHYSLAGGEVQRSLSVDDLAGAEDIRLTNTTTTVCNQLSMTESSCFLLALSATDFEIDDAVAMFPNPATDFVSIKNKSSIAINGIKIYGINGNLVHVSLGNSFNTLTTIATNNLSQGMYFVNLETDLGMFTKKLIVN